MSPSISTTRLPGDTAATEKRIYWVAASIFFFAATIKIIGASQEHTILIQRSPELVWLTQRQLYLGTAFIEVIASCYLFFSSNPRNQYRFLIALALGIWAYRLAFWLAGIEGPCACLGNMWHWTGLSTETVEKLAVVLLLGVTLCAASVIFLRGKARKARKEGPAEWTPEGKSAGQKA
jgi:hypothetical protein